MLHSGAGESLSKADFIGIQKWLHQSSSVVKTLCGIDTSFSHRSLASPLDGFQEEAR
jgi:hypothetical protein